METIRETDTKDGSDMEMKKDDQKSIIIDVKMKNSEKWYALETDKQLRACTQDCRTSALYQGIGRGDEVIYTINAKGQFSYLKATGQKFDLAQLPQPADTIIDRGKLPERKNEPIYQGFTAEGWCKKYTEKLKEFIALQEQLLDQPAPVPDKPKTDWERKFDAEQRKNQTIVWEALLNTATDIVMMSGVPSESGLVDVVKRVEKTAECLHEFIMVKTGGAKPDPYHQNEREKTHP